MPAQQAPSSTVTETGLVPEPSGSQDPGEVKPAAIRPLEAIIEKLATNAPPVVREIAARAAELAANAGDAAGPVAHRVAGLTEELGGRLAVKGRDLASGLRSRHSDGPSLVRPDDSSARQDLP